ncbi:hypothetical protein [Microbacterium ureisolvens]|uniref:Uncharacterized protein n=1 Tax=Microbacterium ureisolvens TaxID=2781186 RepID=A0ABS7I3I5_9MICO|nr:hypothetical protein [Microbacterium ureisolvens]MBW9111694.1 hypothetical protein [Microbacterium ureisolvens]
MKVLDVTALAAAITPEAVKAESFTFVPYFRTGAAAGIRLPLFAPTESSRAVIEVTFTLGDGAGGTETVSQKVGVRGPGDVVAIDPAQIIRRHPVAGTGNAPTGDLVHIEFDAPDLPWMFTPAAPRQGMLPPWVRLVVVRTRSLLEPPQPPAGPDLPPSQKIPRSELPPPEEAWAWAHAQVAGKGLSAAQLADSLGAGSPRLNLSRLLSPRRLTPNEQWTALVVPTFEAGRLAGLGQTPVDTLAWSWGEGDTALLPVYDRWEFATGPALGFEELARQIVPVPAARGLGRRWVDTSQPGAGVDASATDGPRGVLGALIAPTLSGRPEPGDEGRWDAAATAALRALVNPSPTADDPEVGPPLYGGAHLELEVLPEQAQEPEWLSELSLDPAQRIAAALGAAVVRMDQEHLMAGAWAQLPNVRQVDAVLRAAQFARFTATALHRRTIERMLPGAMLGATARAHARTMAGEVTARGQIARSALPPAATSAAARRLVRPLGHAARFAADDEKALIASGVLADGDAGADWVLPIPEPPTSGEGRPMRALEEGGDASLLQHVAPDDEATATLREVIDELPVPLEVEAFPDGPELEVLFDETATLLALGWRLALSRPVWELPAVSVARFPDTGAGPDDPPEFDSGRLNEGIFEAVFHALERRGFGGAHPLEVGPGEEEIRGLFGDHDPGIVETLVDGFFGDLPEPVEPPRPRLDLVALDLPRLLLPVFTVPRRVATRLPGFAAMFGRDPDDLATVMAAPEFRHPLYEALSRYDQEWLMPGVAAIPEPDMVTAMQTNPEFVEAFLVGANHEFARELVWREYPTDGRATSLRRFWTRDPDLESGIHAMRTGALGSHLDDARSGKLVFVVRGELVRRFPHVLANAAASATDDGFVVTYEPAPVTPLFRIALSPNLLIVAVDLTSAEVTGVDSDPLVAPPPGAYWFTLAEHVAAPRFGLDEGPAAGGVPERDDLNWAHWTLAPGDTHLKADVPTVSDAAQPAVETAAKVAWALFQRPARVGFRVRTLLDKIGEERDDG